MTRLAIVRQRYNPAGGAERFVSRALDALARQGSLDVTLITRRWEDHAGYHSLTVNPFYLGNVWRDAGFAEYFGHVTGTTPFRYLAACRIDRADELLHETDLPIADIALQCGYRSERAFREAFVLAHQMRPLAFRKARRAQSG